MKTSFIFIDEALNNKKTFLCFLLLLLGTLTSSYNQGSVYNNFFLNIYNIFTSPYFLLAMIFAFLINNLNIIEELFSKSVFSLRISKVKKNNFYKKELVLSNLLICTIAFILTFAFSIFFSTNNYTFFEEINGLKVYILDIFMIINFLILSIFSGLLLLIVGQLFNKNIAIVFYLLIYSIISYFLFMLPFKMIIVLSLWLIILILYLFINGIEKRRTI